MPRRCSPCMPLRLEAMLDSAITHSMPDMQLRWAAGVSQFVGQAASEHLVCVQESLGSQHSLQQGCHRLHLADYLIVHHRLQAHPVHQVHQLVCAEGSFRSVSAFDNSQDSPPAIPCHMSGPSTVMHGLPLAA